MPMDEPPETGLTNQGKGNACIGGPTVTAAELCGNQLPASTPAARTNSLVVNLFMQIADACTPEPTTGIPML